MTSKLIFTIRCFLCELFIEWATKVAPDGYVPSYVEAIIDAYKCQGKFADIGR